MDRRKFLVGCSSAIAAMAGGRLSGVALAAPSVDAEILVTVFLRGGWDVLSALPPLEGPDRGHYEAARPGLKIPVKGEGAALNIGGPLGLHPALEPLLDLYKGGKLAIIPATGLSIANRSHFDAQEYLELGTPGQRTSSTGWMTRFLETMPETEAVFSQAMALQNGLPTALRGNFEAVSVQKLQDFRFGDDQNYLKYLYKHLERIWEGDSPLHAAGQGTLRALQTLSSKIQGDYVPAGGAKYPDGSFGEGLQTLARAVRTGLGVRAATVDLGGWDTHQWQGVKKDEHFYNMLGELSSGLRALFDDLAGTPEKFERRLTVVVMSEFGRRLSENASGGTDHGHGGAMLVLGGGVRGGKVYGRWPGLSHDQLFERSDLAVTTDYRTVLSEILLEKFKHPRLGEVFPGFKLENRLGVV